MQKIWPSKKEIAACKQIMRKAGKNYFFASRLFPKKLREATYVLYAFYRVPDNIVDVTYANQPELALKELVNWEHQWDQAFSTLKSDQLVLSAAAKIHKIYHIPIKYSHAFFRAMKQDVNKSYYKTYEELKNYMYGSAAVVGIMMTYLIGQKDRKIPSKEILNYSEALGYAMQLTNFLRDIHEDISLRNRIYLPEVEMQKFGISHNLIKQKRYTKSWHAFMHNQINQCHSLYNTANKGIPMLNKSGRFAVLLASNLYRYYLKLIIDSEYKVYHTKYKITFLTKVKILINTLFKNSAYDQAK